MVIDGRAKRILGSEFRKSTAIPVRREERADAVSQAERGSASACTT
jgi:hypothetical protein